MKMQKSIIVFLLLVVCLAHEPDSPPVSQQVTPPIPQHQTRITRRAPPNVPPPDLSDDEAAPRPITANEYVHPNAQPRVEPAQPIIEPAVSAGSARVNVVRIPANRLTPPDPDNYDYATGTPYKYTGPETALHGKERYFANSGTFKTWDRFKDSAKDVGTCQSGQNAAFEGYKSYFEALELKNNADVALALGYTQYYDQFLPKYRQLYRTAKSQVAAGMETLYKSCTFGDLVCFLTNVAKWREINYSKMIKDLLRKGENSNSEKMTNAFVGRVKYIQKKLVLLKNRLKERGDMLINLQLQCPDVAFLTVSQ